jgi:hypothetical protein
MNKRIYSRSLAIMGGRRTRPLTNNEVLAVSTTFIGLDPTVQTVRYEPGARAVFQVISAADSETGEEYGEIVFGPDIYPGPGLANPNSVLSMKAAAAHELAHYHRWMNKTQLNGDDKVDLDEALTSLDAVMRYEHVLSRVDVRELINDAYFRLSKNINEEPETESSRT